MSSSGNCGAMSPAASASNWICAAFSNMMVRITTSSMVARAVTMPWFFSITTLCGPSALATPAPISLLRIRLMVSV